jgi:regulator of sigma E protease
MNDQPVADVSQWLSQVRGSAGLVLKLAVRRAGALIDIDVTPARVVERAGFEVGQIGAQVGSPPLIDSQHLRHIEYSVPQSILRAIKETGRQSEILLLSLYKLVAGELSAKNLSGPLGIAKVAGDSAGRGLVEFCYMLAFFSINLGVINLLPIPVLDGGHLLLNLVEAVKGSPVSEKIQMVGSQIGLVMIASLMLFAVYNDFLKL